MCFIVSKITPDTDTAVRIKIVRERQPYDIGIVIKEFLRYGKSHTEPPPGELGHDKFIPGNDGIAERKSDFKNR